MLMYITFVFIFLSWPSYTFTSSWKVIFSSIFQWFFLLTFLVSLICRKIFIPSCATHCVMLYVICLPFISTKQILEGKNHHHHHHAGSSWYKYHQFEIVDTSKKWIKIYIGQRFVEMDRRFLQRNVGTLQPANTYTQKST